MAIFDSNSISLDKKKGIDNSVSHYLFSLPLSRKKKNKKQKKTTTTTRHAKRGLAKRGGGEFQNLSYVMRQKHNDQKRKREKIHGNKTEIKHLFSLKTNSPLGNRKASPIMMREGAEAASKQL